jgi:predicted alpha/beta-hydrolase family hydrolase
VTTLELETPHGPARAHLRHPGEASACLVLGHGAGGGVGARDLAAVADAALAQGIAVALVEQPYRVAGRRSPAPAHQLDAAWNAVVGQLLAGELRGLRLIAGGRSSGARVACRTAEAAGAIAVLCLAFPLLPPARAGAADRPSRLAELEAVRVPTLVVQGTHDRFGIPPPGPRRTVAVVAGDHRLTADLDAVASAAGQWLGRIVRPRRRSASAPAAG